MNGNTGIQPTVELATTNGNGFAYPYAVPMMGGNGGFGNGFGSDGLWVLILIALLGGFGNNGFGGGFGGNSNEFAWLSNGQKDIMNNTSDGFNSLHISNQIEGVRDGVSNLATQICGSTADVVSAINGGFSNAEISANARQIADMNQNFNNQLSTLNSFNSLQSSLAQCCCDNRLATCQTQNIVQNEGNAIRFADANNTRDIITNATSNTQAILDKLCQLELDGYKRENDNLRSELTKSDLRASQTAQNAFISQGFSNEVDALYNRLNSCPVPTTPVYGRTPIFTCNNNGCGCNGNGNFI